METIRQQKVASLIQKDIYNVISQLITNTNIILTVSKVSVTQDLQIAKIYVSIFPSENAKPFLDELNEMKYKIRYLLGQKVRHQMRLVPELVFYIDSTLDYINNIEEILKNPTNPIL